MQHCSTNSLFQTALVVHGTRARKQLAPARSTGVSPGFVAISVFCRPSALTTDTRYTFADFAAFTLAVRERRFRALSGTGFYAASDGSPLASGDEIMGLTNSWTAALIERYNPSPGELLSIGPYPSRVPTAAVTIQCQSSDTTLVPNLIDHVIDPASGGAAVPLTIPGFLPATALTEDASE